MLISYSGSCGLTWTSRLLFSDRVSSGRWPGDEKIKKNIGKLGIRTSCISYALCQASSFIRIASYILFSRVRMGWNQQEACQTLSHKGNTGYLKRITVWAHRGLGTDNHSPILWAELGSQDLKPKLPQGSGPRPLPSLLTVFLVLEKEPCSFFNIRISGKPWIKSQPWTVGSAPRSMISLALGSLKDKTWFLFSWVDLKSN